jgi:FlaG/FlaF family flagellin (archaellin)
MKKIKSESGVSELIGAILLVSLVVMLMMVVTTVLISQPRPEKIPELSASITYSNQSPDNYFINITHIGGDGLKAGEYLIVIDGTEVKTIQLFEPNPNPYLWDLKKDWTFDSPLMVVKWLNKPKPKTVELYYNGPSNKVLLAKTNFE